MTVFLLLPLLLLFIYQGVSRSTPLPPEPRIVNGITSKSSEFPFIAAIRSIEQDQNGLPFMSEAWCGGSLLRKEYPAVILTSGHCVFNITNQLIIELNASDVTETPIIGITAWPAIAYIMHEQFDRFLLDNDIALIFIDADLTERPDLYLSTVTIPNLIDTECCTNHETLQTMGYGRASLSVPSSHALKYSDLEFIDRTVCNEQLCLWETRSTNCPWYYANENNICALGEFTAPCMGDSGGPLLKIGTDQQVGIMSWGTLCITTLPTIFTNTGAYYTWIQHQLLHFASDLLPILSTTNDPTLLPSLIPTQNPIETMQTTNNPLNVPSMNPSSVPSMDPSNVPSMNPTDKPSEKTRDPRSNAPSQHPTDPSAASTNIHTTYHATSHTTQNPSHSPSHYPSVLPTTTPTETDVPTRYVWRFPTSIPSHAPSSNPTEEYQDTTDIATSLSVSEVNTTTISSIQTTEMYSIRNGHNNPMDLTVLNRTTFDEYLIIIILAGISCVAIFVVIILCLQRYHCAVYNEDDKSAYDRVKTVPNPLIVLDEEDDDNGADAVECVVECVARHDKDKDKEMDHMEEDRTIDDLMAETTSSQTPNRSLLSAISLQSANQ